MRVKTVIRKVTRFGSGSPSHAAWLRATGTPPLLGRGIEKVLRFLNTGERRTRVWLGVCVEKPAAKSTGGRPRD